MALTYEPIATYTLPSNAVNYTFTSIPGTYTDLICRMSVKNVSTGSIDFLLNVDTSQAYSRLVYYSGTSTVGSIDYSGQYQGRLTGNADPLSTAFCQYEFSINSYANASYQKNIQYKSWARNQGTDIGVNNWTGTAAITSIRILNSAGNNFAAGSTFTLYGITKA